MKFIAAAAAAVMVAGSSAGTVSLLPGKVEEVALPDNVMVMDARTGPWMARNPEVLEKEFVETASKTGRSLAIPTADFRGRRIGHTRRWSLKPSVR